MWGLVDCDNCYCSCERVFRPELNGRAVVVLSNNDGCVIARSAEAKALGIAMGMPYFKMLQQYQGYDITAFSSNYALYADMSARIMSILREEAPAIIQYSIDEAFLDLRGMDHLDLKAWGEGLSKKIKRWTGMPVSIGIAPSKTLAKVGSKFAKKYAGYNKCCLIGNDEQREAALKLFPVGDVWGIGRRIAAFLEAQGITTAYDLTTRSRLWARQKLHVTGERTWAELRGEDCILVDDMNIGRKSIMTSRSFPEMLTEFDDVKSHVANFAARCAEKLRGQGSACALVSAFVDTNHFRPDLPQYGAQAATAIATPTNATAPIVNAAIAALRHAFRQGYAYKRAGVMVDNLSSAALIQPDAFDYQPEQRRKQDSLSAAIDRINAVHGKQTVMLGAQQYRESAPGGEQIKFENAIKRNLKSPNYTTRIEDFRIKN